MENLFVISELRCKVTNFLLFLQIFEPFFLLFDEQDVKLRYFMAIMAVF